MIKLKLLLSLQGHLPLGRFIDNYDPEKLEAGSSMARWALQIRNAPMVAEQLLEHPRYFVECQAEDLRFMDLLSVRLDPNSNEERLDWDRTRFIYDEARKLGIELPIQLDALLNRPEGIALLQQMISIDANLRAASQVALSPDLSLSSHQSRSVGSLKAPEKLKVEKRKSPREHNSPGKRKHQPSKETNSKRRKILKRAVVNASYAEAPARLRSMLKTSGSAWTAAFEELANDLLSAKPDLDPMRAWLKRPDVRSEQCHCSIGWPSRYCGICRHLHDLLVRIRYD